MARGPCATRGQVLAACLWTPSLCALSCSRSSGTDIRPPPPTPRPLKASPSNAAPSDPGPRVGRLPGQQAPCPVHTHPSQHPGSTRPAADLHSQTSRLARPLSVLCRQRATCLPPQGPPEPPPGWTTCSQGPHPGPTPPQAACPVKFPIPGSPLACALGPPTLSPPAEPANTVSVGNTPHPRQGPLSKRPSPHHLHPPPPLLVPLFPRGLRPASGCLGKRSPHRPPRSGRTGSWNNGLRGRGDRRGNQNSAENPF